MKKNTQLNIRNKKMSRYAKRHIRPVAKKMKIKKGDEVMIVSGKDKGKTGKVVHAFPMTGKVIVEGLNMAKRHLRRVGNQSGRIAEMERAIDASNVMLVDPKGGKPTRVKRVRTDGKNVRTAVKSGTALA